MEITNLIPHIEALIFASDRPLTTLEVTELANGAFGFKITEQDHRVGQITDVHRRLHRLLNRVRGNSFRLIAVQRVHNPVVPGKEDSVVRLCSPPRA